MYKLLGAAVALLAAVTMTTPTADAGVSRQTVHGRMSAVDSAEGAGRDAKGRFRILGNDFSRHTVEKVQVDALRLDATADDEGRLPEYRVVLVHENGTTEADFGVARIAANGRARFRWSSRQDEYPEGVTTVRAFGGGKIELRRDGAAVLRGEVPDFIDIDDDSSSGSSALAQDTNRLSPVVAGGSGAGYVFARYQNRRAGTSERLQLEVALLRRQAGPYVAVAIDGAGAETTLGTFDTRGRLGAGGFSLDTRNGDAIPGGSVLDHSGSRVEVRDRDGNAVLAGTFPEID